MQVSDFGLSKLVFGQREHFPCQCQYVLVFHLRNAFVGDSIGHRQPVNFIAALELARIGLRWRLPFFQNRFCFRHVGLNVTSSSLLPIGQAPSPYFMSSRLQAFYVAEGEGVRHDCNSASRARTLIR